MVENPCESLRPSAPPEPNFMEGGHDTTPTFEGLVAPVTPSSPATNAG